MKKIVIIIILLISCGCAKEHTICKSHIKNAKQNYESYTTYDIKSHNNYVKHVTINEKYKSKDQNVLDYFDSYLKLTYLTLKEEYGYITYQVKNTKNSIEYLIDIDYDKTNIKEMVKDGYLNKDYVINNQITRNGLIKQYESKGAKCN